MKAETPETWKMLEDRDVDLEPETELPSLQEPEEVVEQLVANLYGALEERNPIALYWATQILEELPSTAGYHFGRKKKRKL